jgi:WD40 repeat protein
MTTDGNYVITADRDEKIRISCYPMAQEIHYFCLGHTEMLIWVCPLSNNLLLSAAADSTVRLWSIETGKCLSAFNTGSSIPSSYALHSADSVWISYENSNKIDLFKIQNGNNLIKESTIEVNSLVFCLSSIKGYLIALVADKPHLLSPSNNLDTLDKINENISLEIKVESGGKSRLKKQRDATKYKKPRLA